LDLFFGASHCISTGGAEQGNSDAARSELRFRDERHHSLLVELRMQRHDSFGSLNLLRLCRDRLAIARKCDCDQHDKEDHGRSQDRSSRAQECRYSPDHGMNNEPLRQAEQVPRDPGCENGPRERNTRRHGGLAYNQSDVEGENERRDEIALCIERRLQRGPIRLLVFLANPLDADEQRKEGEQDGSKEQKHAVVGEKAFDLNVRRPEGGLEKMR
jgi:hypothetical protein